MRWSRGAAAALGLVAATTLAGCGTNDPTTAGPGPDEEPSFVTGSPVVFEEGQYPLGEEVDWDDTLRFRADAVGVDSDDLGPWLTLAVHVENTGTKPRPLPHLELSCDGGEGGTGILAEGGTPPPTAVPAGGSLDYEERLTLSGDGRTGESIPRCTGEVTVDITLQGLQSATSMSAWTVPDDLVEELNARRPTPASGGQQEVSPGLLVDIVVESVGGDGQQAWLNVRVDHDNGMGGEQSLDAPTMHCAQSDGSGGMVRPRDLSVAGSGGMRVELLMPPGDDGEPLTSCDAPAYVEIGPGRWTLSADDLDYLNEELARDPGRPYSWVATEETFSSGYQVVIVPDATAAEALAALGPNLREVSQQRFWAIRVAELGDAVVLFTWALVTDEQVKALSRVGGLAASYGNTVEGDDHILIARDGRVVRAFDPFFYRDFPASKRLLQEKGLDFENDTGPASWTLLERVTKVHITKAWLMDPDHPAYLVE